MARNGLQSFLGRGEAPAIHRMLESKVEETGEKEEEESGNGGWSEEGFRDFNSFRPADYLKNRGIKTWNAPKARW